MSTKRYNELQAQLITRKMNHNFGHGEESGVKRIYLDLTDKIEMFYLNMTHLASNLVELIGSYAPNSNNLKIAAGKIANYVTNKLDEAKKFVSSAIDKTLDNFVKSMQDFATWMTEALSDLGTKAGKLTSQSAKKITEAVGNFVQALEEGMSNIFSKGEAQKSTKHQSNFDNLTPTTTPPTKGDVNQVVC